MRKIKFRGKTAIGNYWVEGSLFIEERTTIHYAIASSTAEKNWAIRYVNEVTIGQYTEVNDKNDKEIYEGDIVHISSEYDDNEWNALVEEQGKINVIDMDIEYTHINWWGGYTFEVLGNKYDNPELLETCLKPQI